MPIHLSCSPNRGVQGAVLAVQWTQSVDESPSFSCPIVSLTSTWCTLAAGTGSANEALATESWRYNHSISCRGNAALFPPSGWRDIHPAFSFFIFLLFSLHVEEMPHAPPFSSSLVLHQGPNDLCSRWALKPKSSIHLFTFVWLASIAMQCLHASYYTLFHLKMIA